MTDVQILNMTFDIWSAVFSVILIIGVFVSRRYNRLQAKSLMGALAANAGINVFEIFAYVFRGDVSLLGWWMVRISNFAVFLGNHLILIFAAAFIVRTTARDGVVTGKVLVRAFYVVIITGAGRSFIAGADISEMAPMSVEEGLQFSELGNGLLMRVDMFPKPTIAAVNGFALGGGCEMALACDIRVASEKAKFGQPEVGLGIIPGFGGTQRMARIIGTGPAMELIYTADTINAQRALELGMVNHVYAPEELMDKALKLANKIAANAQVAIRTSKMAIRRGIDCDISTAVTYEALAFATCFGTEDQKDAMKAFVEKRKLDGFKNR